MTHWRTAIVGFVALSFLCSAGLVLGTSAGAAEAPRMSIEELKAQLGKPDVSIVDVRLEKSWDKSDKKIKGAVRENSAATDTWAKKYDKDKLIILYCS